uniref:Uncharacterized protein n=1 Tax=Eptatretus burgeri TaxID=7764 RepID=A0A8C4PVW3_EPTBU
MNIVRSLAQCGTHVHTSRDARAREEYLIPENRQMLPLKQNSTPSPAPLTQHDANHNLLDPPPLCDDNCNNPECSVKATTLNLCSHKQQVSAVLKQDILLQAQQEFIDSVLTKSEISRAVTRHDDKPDVLRETLSLPKEKTRDEEEVLFEREPRTKMPVLQKRPVPSENAVAAQDSTNWCEEIKLCHNKSAKQENFQVILSFNSHKHDEECSTLKEKHEPKCFGSGDAEGESPSLQGEKQENEMTSDPTAINKQSLGSLMEKCSPGMFTELQRFCKMRLYLESEARARTRAHLSLARRLALLRLIRDLARTAQEHQKRLQSCYDIILNARKAILNYTVPL